MSFFRKKGPAVITVCFTAAVLITALFFLVRFYAPSKLFATPNMFLEGEYSVDGGEWKPIDLSRPIDDHFHRIVFRGRLIEDFAMYEDLSISAKNLWYTLRELGGQTLLDHVYHSEEDIYRDMEAFGLDPETIQYFAKMNLDLTPLAVNMPDTPGYSTKNVFFSHDSVGPEFDIRQKDLVLEVENPYSRTTYSFSEAFKAVLGSGDERYVVFFFNIFPLVALFILVCFFGLFFFPAASFILGRVNYKYLAFGILCFLWGVYMIIRSVDIFLNIWITDPTVCVLVDKLIRYAFYAAIFVYLRANLVRSKTKAIAGALCLCYIPAVIAVTVLHLTGTADVVVTTLPMYIVCGLLISAMFALLFSEIKQNAGVISFIISWIPLVISLLIDLIFWFFDLSGRTFFVYGLAATMLYQIFRIVLDLKKQYREAIRYQQMQKELYEAKVGVMVSQIQPHFMYNALTSIAMMCEIDPPTAKEATVTFAKYLRGNMDSLKQTAPVPFETELEHLKKYLYIEKLRFDDMLNIEYDIQTTDFELPLLSIQPLVENAVKHGVGMKKNGGTVTIRTRETPDAYEVIVEDDGVGFDTSAPPKDDGRSHVGMENTEKRLKDMCNAGIVIESRVGAGTTARVIIPKKKTADE